MRSAKLAGETDRLSWTALRSHLRSRWEAGQHFSIIAPTGKGKTTIAVRGLLPLWKYSVTLDAKGDDPSLDAAGKRVPRYPSGLFARYDNQTRYRINPPSSDMDVLAESFGDVLRSVWQDKGWAVYVDELRLFSDPRYMDLGRDVERLWLFGRARDITLIAGTQAPRWVPAAAYEQASRFLIGRVQDKRALDRLGEISGDVDRIREVVPTLDVNRYEFLYVDGVDDFMAVTSLDLARAQA